MKRRPKKCERLFRGLHKVLHHGKDLAKPEVSEQALPSTPHLKHQYEKRPDIGRGRKSQLSHHFWRTPPHRQCNVVSHTVVFRAAKGAGHAEVGDEKPGIRAHQDVSSGQIPVHKAPGL